MYSIELDEQLVKEAMVASGKKTLHDTIHIALQSFIKAHNRQKILRYQGKGVWDGNLDELRATR